jgi:hypothetical protein
MIRLAGIGLPSRRSKLLDGEGIDWFFLKGFSKGYAG